MAAVKGAPNTVFDDASIAPFGQKLMGNHQFALADGETGTPLGYVSPGHNSAYYDA
jgi:arabinan endo-1,5-alpha-L-arabinosidase